MSTHFGYGFERRSSKCPSAQLAQSVFLELLPELRDDVVPSLFEIAFKPFQQFLIDHHAEIFSIVERVKLVPFPIDTAVRILLYGWPALVHQEGAELFCGALREWANKWNLSDNWCLNHAVLTLREWHQTSGCSGLSGPLGAWQDSVASGLKWDSIFTQAEFNKEFRQEGLFEFTYTFDKLHLKAEGPFWRPIAEFKGDVDKKFKAIGGSKIRGARKALKYQLSSYVSTLGKLSNKLYLEESPVRWADDHFQWLVHYQIPPCKGYREIGRQFGKDEASVREGIQGVAKLISLTLRPSERGRPRGAQDSKPRHRATRS